MSPEWKEALSGKDVFGMSPFEFCLYVDSIGLSLDREVVEEIIFGMRDSRSVLFVSRCLLDSDVFDFAFSGGSVVRTLLMKEGMIDMCSKIVDREDLLFQDIVSKILSRRPGLLLKYYLGDFPGDMRRYHSRYPGFSLFEETVYDFVGRYGKEESFPKDVAKRVEETHREIWGSLFQFD